MSPFDTPKRFAVILGALLVAAFAWGTSDALAQEEATLSIDTERAQAGEAVDVPVQATGFNDVGAVSLTVTYDPAVTSFPDGNVETGDLISGAPRSGFEANRPEPGELRITWFDQEGNPIDLGDGTLLNITFSNFAGGAGNVVFDEANSEVSDAQGDPIAVSFENGAVIDQDAGTVSAGTVSGATLNETVSVPLSGQDLQDVGAASLEIGFDTSSLRFEGISNDQSGLELRGSAENGTVLIAGQNFEGGGSLGDDFVEVEFSFLGGPSNLDFLVSSEVADLQGNVLPAEFADGSVSGDTPLVSFPDRGVNAGDTISVPVQAEDLQEVGAVTLETTYDPSVLTFEGTEEGFAGLDDEAVSNPSAGVVRIGAFGQNTDGIDPSDNDDKFINLIFAVEEGADLGTESILGFNADASELANTDAEPYNTAFESGLVRVEETEIAVSPDAVSYDVTAIDSTSSRVVTVSNESDSVATLEGEVSGTGTPFAIASGGGSFTLAPGESRDVTVDYAPTEVSNPDQDTLLITHNADNEASPTEVPLSGEAEAPSIAAQVVPSDTTVRSGQPVTLTQTVTNEAADVAVLEAQVTSVPGFLTLTGSEIEGGGSFNADSLELSLDPGAEATLTYEFQEEVDSTTVFEEAISHQTNDPANPTVDLPVSIAVDPVQVNLRAQALDLTAGDTELRITDIIANSGDVIVVTTDDGDGAFDDETVVGSIELTEDLDGGDVLVDVEGADPVDHAAHVSLDGTVSGVVATSQTAPVYAVAQFNWEDETVVDETGVVTVDAVEILYNGDVGEDTLSIDLHEVSGGSVGAFVGVSQEDLPVNQEHTDVAVDVVEPVDPGDDNPERIEDTIEETGEFFAMAHRGAAGTDADGERIPAQRPALATTTEPGTVGDFATVEVEREREVALGAQALDLTEGDTEVRVDSVVANPGDAVVITTDDGDGAFDDETVVGSRSVEDSLDSESVLVDVQADDGTEDASPTDHAAHVSLDGTVSGVVATSQTAPVYAVAQFNWEDETVVDETGVVTVDAVEILYNGDVGEDTLSIDLHEVSGGSVGAFVGVSQEDLPVNQEHTDVAVDVVEPVDPGDDNPERIEDTIEETGEFFAMAHRGAAGTDADGERIPAQRPALATTTEPGTVGDFATVEVDLQADITRTFDDPSDPANYEIIALPGNVDVDAAASLEGTQGPDWRVLREEGGDGNLVNYDGSDAFRFREGRAFWVIAKNNFSFQDTVDATDLSSIALQDGWNAVSNPLQEDRAWSAVRNANGLDEDLWRWTDDGDWTQVDTLASAQSGEGFYVFNGAGLDSLSLAGTAGQSTLAGKGSGGKESVRRTIDLTARFPSGAESNITVGVGKEASVYHAPPAHFGDNPAALRVLGSDDKKEHAGMIVKSQDGEAEMFDLVLRGKKNGAATIKTSGLSGGSAPAAVLVVEETGETHELREASSITVPTGKQGEAPLTLHVGTEEQVREVAIPDETKLRGNYPNPFSDRTTLELSISEPTDVKVQVYNVLGQRVATVADKSMDAGTHQLTWADGSLASGVYFVRMEAGDATDVHKITVVR